MTKAPELDSDGNAIFPGGDENVTLSKAEYDQMTTRLATLAQASDSTVEELKEMRDLNAKLKLQVEEKDTPPADAVDAAVQRALAGEKAKVTKANYETAITKLLGDHPEFSQENDTGGIKFTAFQKAVSRINLNGLTTTEDFMGALSDAYGLMERKDNPAPSNDFSSSPRGGVMPRIQANSTLSPAEGKLVQKYFDGNVELYLKAKDKRPSYYEELLRYAR